MVDYSVTAANVQHTANATVRDGTAGEAITVGQVVYKDSTDSNKIKVADCTDANKYAAVGVAVSSAAADGQLVDYVEKDLAMNLGATLAIGDVILLSTTGGIMPVADLASNDYAVFIGVATSTSTANVMVGANTRAEAVKA